MIRIGSFAAQNLTLSKNMETQARMHEARLQISSGKKAQAYEGIATDTRRLEGLETKHQQISSFKKSVDRTDQRLSEMAGAVDQLQDIASDFRTKLLQATTGDNLGSTNIQGEAQALLNQTVSLLNSEYEGRYLFAGSATDRPPVDVKLPSGGEREFDDVTAAAADIRSGGYYRGNDDVLSARVDGDFTMSYGVTADSEANTGFHDLMKALSRVAFNDGSDLGEQAEHALRDLSGGEIAFETAVAGITDAQQPLSAAPASVTAGGTLTFTRADGTTADVNYLPGDTLDALTSEIAALAGIDAEVVNDGGGDLHLRVHAVDGQPLSVAETGAGDLLTTLGLPPSGAQSEGAIKRLADTHADIGSSQDILQRVRERLEDTRLNVEQGITDIENVDVAKAMTELSGHRTTLESSYAVTARMSQLSLLNFIR
jgi:flagellar hook-associated protein 3 FlgL